MRLPGITRYKTNHNRSLRAIATSTLYQSGVNEQLVMERTGHRSVKVSISVRDLLTISERHRQAFRTAQVVAPVQHSTSAPANLFLAWEEVCRWFSPLQKQKAQLKISSAQLTVFCQLTSKNVTSTSTLALQEAKSRKNERLSDCYSDWYAKIWMVHEQRVTT